MSGHLKVRYEHDSADLTQVWLAVAPPRRPPTEWKAALCDTVDVTGRPTRIVRAKLDVPDGYVVWLRDSEGARDVTRQRVA